MRVGARTSGLLPRVAAALAAILLLLPAALCLLPSHALARGGGGELFGGGTGSDELDAVVLIFYVIYIMFDLIVEAPYIGIPLTAAIIVGIIVSTVLAKRKGTDVVQTHTIRKANRMMEDADRARSDRALASLKQRDPAFAESKCIDRAKAVFVAVQGGWAAQEMSKARHFLSAGVRERYEVQLGLQKAQGFRNRLEDIRVNVAEIAAVASDRHFDTIHARIVGQMRDDYVDLKTGGVIRHNTDEPFVEYWTFMRRPGAKTLAGGGLVEGHCPSCGAELKLSDAGVCDYCKALVTSGDYDWVLTEITQESEWSPAPDPARVPGHAALFAKDPAFNVASIEDRTSVIFWRLIKARFSRDPAAMASAAHPGFLEELAARTTPGEDGRWTVPHEAAVGAVELRSITVGGDDGFDRVEALVTWSARDAQRGPDGAITAAGDRTIRHQFFMLARKSNAKTAEKSSFRTAPCHSCGAPDEGTQAGVCPYCGAPTNDGGRDWILLSIGVSPAVDRAAAAPAVSPTLVLSAMAGAMFADGAVDEREGSLLQSYAGNHGVPRETLGAIIAAARGGAPLPSPGSHEEAGSFLKAVARVTMADGKVTKEERILLESYGRHLGYVRADIAQVVTAAKAELYQEAKQAIRAIKKGGPA